MADVSPLASHDPSIAFLGHEERFEVRRLLGAGGNGKVYAAFDRLRHTEVALKTLREPDPVYLYLFKREFRELTGVVHPRLVKLYELFAQSERWFYTMELVDGVNFLRHVRGVDRLPDESARISVTDDDLAGPTVTFVERLGPRTEGPPRVSSPPRVELEPEPLDMGRFRQAMRQLAEGVRALHTAGRLHLDLKPTNVLVRHEQSSVVLLDFGLAMTMRRSKRENLRVLAGTPQFMAPEQVLGEELTEAADWYAVGVILYEVLTGRLPFRGSSQEVLEQKLLLDPLPPSALVPDVDRELESLCVALMQRNAADRPSEREIMKVLGLSGVTGRYEAMSAPPPDLGGSGAFVGRASELEQLDEALETSRTGRGVVFLLHGGSGIGKSALVEHFIDRIVASQPLAIILEGRCYEQESVPYKGIDAIVDGLSRFLSVLPDDEVLGYLPAGALALAQLFPVLGQIPALQHAAAPEAVDQSEVRRVAFRALRELMARVSARRPVVIYVDDLQWSDLDSTALLLDVLRPPHAPSVLFIGSYRTEEIERSEPLSRLRGELAASGLAVREIELGPLGADVLRTLATEIAVDVAEVERIVVQSGGSPFLFTEMVRHGAATEALSSGIVERVHALPERMSRFVEVVCLAGHPIPTDVVCSALELEPDVDIPGLLLELKARSLIRGRSGASGLVEPYHDRIREAVAGALPAGVRTELHRRLARALEATGADAVHVLRHLLGCGERELAGRYAVQAAHQARSMLAFERASSLYEIAIDAGADDTGASLRRARADCLVNAGRYASAADVYLSAADLLEGFDSWDLRRIAAGYLIVGGEYDRGVALCDRVFAEVGIGRPRTHFGNILKFVWHEAGLRLRGLSYEPVTEIADSAVQRRLDALWTAGRALAGTVPLESAALLAQGARLALDTGQPLRIALNLGLHAGAVAAFSTARAEQLREPLIEAARRANDPYAFSVCYGALGVAGIFRGRWREGVDHLDVVQEIYRRKCHGVSWELVMTHVMAGFGLYLMGEYEEVARRHTTHLREAEERQDRHGAATLFLAQGWMQRLAWDDPDGLRSQTEHYVQHLSPHLAQYQHYYEVLCRVAALSYVGNFAEALTYMDAEAAALKRGGHFRIDLGRVMFFGIRAAQCIGAARVDPKRGTAMQRLARSFVKKLDSAEMPAAKGMAGLVRGGIAHLEGKLETAAAYFESAEKTLVETDTHGIALCARFHRGRVIGGDEGARLCSEALALLRARGARRPLPFMSMYLPHVE